MDIKRSGPQPSAKGPEEYFTGAVRIDAPFRRQEDRPPPGEGQNLPAQNLPAQDRSEQRRDSHHRHQGR